MHVNSNTKGRKVYRRQVLLALILTGVCFLASFGGGLLFCSRSSTAAIATRGTRRGISAAITSEVGGPGDSEVEQDGAQLTFRRKWSSDTDRGLLGCLSGPRRLYSSGDSVEETHSTACSGHGVCQGQPVGNTSLVAHECECDEGWEGYSCEVPLRDLLGKSEFSLYTNAKQKDSIAPKETGPSPPDGNQYVPSRSVGRLLRPVVPLPLQSSCGEEPNGLPKTEMNDLGKLDCNIATARQLVRAINSLATHTTGGIEGFARIDVPVVVRADVVQSSNFVYGKERSCSSLTSILASFGFDTDATLAGDSSVNVDARPICATVRTCDALSESEGAPSEGAFEAQHRLVVCGFESSLTPSAALTANNDLESPQPAVLANISPPFVFLLNIVSVAEIHEHTNLRLAISQMLTTDVDVLGFNSLYPLPRSVNAPASFMSGADQRDAPSQQQQYLFVSECWDVLLGRWVLTRRRPAFGYRRHDRYTMLCEASAMDVSALILRQHSLPSRKPQTNKSSRGDYRVFEPSMGTMAFVDFYIRVKYDRNKQIVDRQCVGGGEELRSVACGSPTRVNGVALIGTCAECLLKRTDAAFEHYVAARHTNVAFARNYLVEAVKGGIGNEDHRQRVLFLDPFRAGKNHTETEAINILERVRRQHLSSTSGRGFPSKGASRVVNSSLTIDTVDFEFEEKGHSSLRITTTQRVACAKSGGIYGPSKDGRFASYCQRLQRRQSFLLLNALWTNSVFFQPQEFYKMKPANRPSKRYALSVHAGNLFGALRIEKELLWETDGDFDLVAFDDDHGELMERFRKLLAFLGGGGDSLDRAFTVKMSEEGKPWYASILRDSVDFQLNARSVRDPKTRGKPPHIHNISVIYEGVRVFVNGFQNPWQGVRSAAGHDYRRLYLAQQKWTPNRHHGRSIECGKDVQTAKKFSHLCLPPCNTPQYQFDHSYCDLVPPQTQWQLSLVDDSHEVV